MLKKISRNATFSWALLPAILLTLLLLPGPVCAQIQLSLEDSTIVVIGQAGVKGSNLVATIEGPFDLIDPNNICIVEGDLVLGGRLNTRTSTLAPGGDTEVVLQDGVARLRNFSKGSNLFTPVPASDVVTEGTAGISWGNTAGLSADRTCPDLPVFPVFVAGGADVICTQAGTDIFPGTYQDLIVQFKGKCNFKGPGTYNFRRILTQTAGTYEFNFEPLDCSPENPHILNVTEWVNLKEYGSFNAQGAKSVFVHVAGADGLYGSTNPNQVSPFTGLPSAFAYYGDGSFNACYVYVPNGSTALRGKSEPVWFVQFLTKYYFEFGGLRIVLATQEDYAECCTPGFRDCACILDIPVSAAVGDTIEIKGKGFNTTTVKRVLFYEESNTTIGSFLNAQASADCFVDQADITYVDATTITLEIPATCATGVNYRLAVDDGAFCVDKDQLLQITP